MTQTDCSIIIPIFDSEDFIVDAVFRIVDACSAASLSAEVLLCDDGSSDRSREMAVNLSERFPAVQVLSNEKNQGLGYTLRKLIRASSTDKIIYADIDLPFGTEGVLAVYRELDHADIVAASRYMGAANHVPIGRKIISRAYWLLCRILFDIRVRDIGSGTVGFRRSQAEALDLRSDGFDIHVELYAKAQRKGLRIKEIALPSEKDNAGTFRVFKHIGSVVRGTLRWGQILRG